VFIKEIKGAKRKAAYMMCLSIILEFLLTCEHICSQIIVLLRSKMLLGVLSMGFIPEAMQSCLELRELEPCAEKKSKFVITVV